ncbi:hypothetical protein pEaSNUABM5_00156 [Erwinia phage pEa_SNUABM_5]|uniref:KTSC and Metallopeptidase-like N-terminal fusion domain-containing protein n=1 Tax=Erwinia phage pEa_SNUABM_5 TaxID=2797313 RepID=A0A7T8EPI0_9CAUD|nr:hypothetical protein MPK73_gp156 [Erwinia phage pEa_SNUABM_5]QQO90298.1 hypothetical protein pEaSNUABM5_00156 [Erwinia phage pEa_SNUABM_5]
MHSLSATYDDAVNKYAWYTFDGPRGREVTQRSHKRMIKNGDVFGLVASRTGSRFTLIFPDMPHIDFPIDKAAANFFIDRSKKMRSVPSVVKREGRTKSAGAVTMERQLARRQIDNPRFAPRKTPVESAHGIDFSNYQWRIIEQPNYKIKHSKGIEQFIKNDVIGVRFLRESKGGIVINQDGMYIKVPTEEYDRIVADSKVLAFPDWPVGTLTAEEVLSYRKQLRRLKQTTAVEKAAAARLAQRADRIALQLEQREVRRQQRKATAEEERRMAELRAKVRSGEMEAPGPKVIEDLHPVFKADIRRGVRRVLREERMLDDEELDLNEVLRNDMTHEEDAMSDILVTNPFGADSLGIEDSIAKLFGRDDDVDDDVDDDGAFDLSAIDEPEDDEEPPAPKAKVRKKGTAPVAAAPDATEEDDDNPDDSEDDEDNQDEESDVEEDEDADADADDEADIEADEDTDDDASDDENTDESDEEDEDVDDSDADASSAVDESDDAESDPDVEAADDEASKTPQDYAKQNANPVGSKAREAEEGDIVRFNADAKLQRDWVILRVSTHNASDNIVIYTVFDITNSPDEVRQVRVNRARKQNLFDYCTHVKDMTPKLFNRVYDLAEDYPVNKEPITS